MHLFTRCCLGTPSVSGNDFEAQRSPGRTSALAKEPSIRRKSVTSQGLSQACATACANLPFSACEQWPQRISSALIDVEATLQCAARLVIYSADGLPWVFASNDWVADDSDRITLSHLADVLAHQVADTAVVLRRTKDMIRDAYRVLSWPAGQSVVMEPLDLLALPICKQGAPASAALLLGWERPIDKMGCVVERHGGSTFLSTADLKELRRLTHFIGYGLLGDPQHARYIARVCRYLALLLAAPSLHDLLITMLEGLHDLVLTKFALHLQPVLAAVHGATVPAVLLALRNGGYPSLPRPCTSDTHAQASAILSAYGSASSAPVSRPLLSPNHLAALGADNSNSMALITGASDGSPHQPEASRVRAIKTPMAHTLLLQATRANSQPVPLVRDQGSTRDGSVHGSQHCNANDVTTRGEWHKLTGSAGSNPARGGPAGGRPPLHTVVVPNASSHLLEDQQPCRDLLTCSKMTGMKLGSILLMAEVAGQSAAGVETAVTCCTSSNTRAFFGGGGDEENLACIIRSSEVEGRSSAVTPASPRAAAFPGGHQRQAPYQLALYLLSAEMLPAGVLRMVSKELQALLPMFFGTFRAALASCDTSQSCMLGDWRRLQDQLLGQNTMVDGSDGPEAMPDKVVLPAALFETAMNSPLSPVAPHRSAISSRLFRSNAALSPLPVATPSNLPPVYCPAFTGSPLTPGHHHPKSALSGLAVSQGSGLVRRGVMALMAAREDASSQPHALSTSGSAIAAGALASNHRSFKNRLTEVPFMDTASPSDGRAGSATSLNQRGSGALQLSSLPQVTLERAAGPSAVDMLVSSMRQVLTAAGADEIEEQAAQAQDLAAVQLLEVLGRGGQGVVFRGTLHGLEAAVKVLTDSGGGAGFGDEPRTPGAPGERDGMEYDSGGMWSGDGKAVEARIRQAKRGAMEVAVIGTLSHPSIVQVYATFSGVVVVRCQYHDSPQAEMRLCFPGDEMLAGKDPGPLNQVICLEYCDAGTLLTAARSGAFRQPFAIATNGAAFPASVPLYTSLLEVALGLRYLHSRKLVHCDVKAANVLLKSSSRDARGWTCKLSDFGCARMLTDQGPEGREDAAPLGFRTAAPVGTLAHMAPECFIKNSLLTTSVDVYSFGVLMWELLMCRTPYSGMNAKEVPRQVIRHNLRPVFHPLAPAPFCALAVHCWSAKPERRPTAIELVGQLEQLLADAQAESEKESKMAATAAAAKAASQPNERLKQPGNCNGGQQVTKGAQPMPPKMEQARSLAPEQRVGIEAGSKLPLAASLPGASAIRDLLSGAFAPTAEERRAAEPGGRQASDPRRRDCDNDNDKNTGSGGGDSDSSCDAEAQASAICLLPFTNPGTL